jgi:hypothetical protein
VAIPPILKNKTKNSVALRKQFVLGETKADTSAWGNIHVDGLEDQDC